MLIDPNAWSEDGATALAEWTPSEDGKLVTYAVQDGGTDWRTVRVIDVATGKILADELKWLKFGGGVEWAKDGSGFYYSRFPEPAAGQTFQALEPQPEGLFPQARHAAGRRPAGLCDARQSRLRPWRDAQRGRPLAGRHDLGRHRRPLRSDADRPRASPNAKPRTLIKGFTNNYSYVGNDGETFYFVTNDGAPKLKLVALDVAQAGAHAAHADRRGCGDARRRVAGRRQARSPAIWSTRRPRCASTTSTASWCARSTLPGIGTAGGLRRHGEGHRDLLRLHQLQPPDDHLSLRRGERRRRASGRRPSSPSIPTITASSSASTRRRTAPACRCSSSARRASPARRRRCSTPMAGSTCRSTPGYSPTRLAWLEAGGTYVARQHSRRRRIWQGVARRRPPRQQAERVRRLHRRGRISEGAGDHRQGPARDPGRLERRPAGRRGGQPASRSVRRGAPGGRRDGHAALRPLHRRALLGRRLWLSQQGGRFPRAATPIRPITTSRAGAIIRRCW